MNKSIKKNIFLFNAFIILLFAFSNESFAQILNMSKGFQWDEDGFGGEVNVSLEDRRGNTDYLDTKGLLVVASIARSRFLIF